MPYPNKQFGQTMKKKQTSSYQRQFGGGSKDNKALDQDAKDAKAAEAAAFRLLKQEQGEAIDIKFGYNRLEDQVIDPEETVERRGWLYHMLATTVRTEDSLSWDGCYSTAAKLTPPRSFLFL
jgi:hypothetical protein